MRVLVTGGAGFLGSHAVVALAVQGHEPHILDDFSNSTPAVLERLGQLLGRTVPFHRADVRNAAALASIFDEMRPEAVLHFAGLKSVSESIQQPDRYLSVNVAGTACLLSTMRQWGVRHLVFSSSATVYGPGQDCVDESAPLAPSNPYAESKLACERLIQSVGAQDEGFCYAILRYFNPVGAHPSGLLGENPLGAPNNLMPSICDVAIGRRDRLLVFGSDYPTPDGTGVRDYVHVMDIAEAHFAALARLSAQPRLVLNLGRGKGLSVLELVAAFESATGQVVPLSFVPRRPGDIATLYADPGRARRALNWSATRSPTQMCVDAWRWVQGRERAG